MIKLTFFYYTEVPFYLAIATSSVTMSNMDAQTNSAGSARAERKEREKEKIIQREKQRHTLKTV